MSPEIIRELREYYLLPAWVTDEEIEKELKGSLGEGIINFRIAKKKLKDEVYKILPEWFKKLTRG